MKDKNIIIMTTKDSLLTMNSTFHSRRLMFPITTCDINNQETKIRNSRSKE